LNIYFWLITYVNLFILMCTIGVLPDWTIDEYGIYLVAFVTWVLIHLKKCIMSLAIVVGFLIFIKFQERFKQAIGVDHVSFIHFNWREAVGLAVKKRPIEIFIWKVEDLNSSTGKMYKANDIFVECHLGDNEPMRSRVHNNAGTSCMLKESWQVNIHESATGTMMTILVKDQGLLTTAELGRLVLSTREVVGIEDQTGKRKEMNFSYSKDNFVELNLLPRGKIWIAIAPVEDIDEEKKPLMRDDDSVMC